MRSCLIHCLKLAEAPHDDLVLSIKQRKTGGNDEQRSHWDESSEETGAHCCLMFSTTVLVMARESIGVQTPGMK